MKSVIKIDMERTMMIGAVFWVRCTQFMQLIFEFIWYAFVMRFICSTTANPKCGKISYFTSSINIPSRMNNAAVVKCVRVCLCIPYYTLGRQIFSKVWEWVCYGVSVCMRLVETMIFMRFNKKNTQKSTQQSKYCSWVTYIVVLGYCLRCSDGTEEEKKKKQNQ